MSLDSLENNDPFQMNLQSVVKQTKKSNMITPFKIPPIKSSFILNSNNSQNNNTASKPKDYNMKNNNVSVSYSTDDSSSLHLSEFEQPPRSTSTPNKGLFDTPIKEITEIYQNQQNSQVTPLRQLKSWEKRPQWNSTPYFKFNPNSFDPAIDKDGDYYVNQDSALSAVSDSPLAHKSRNHQDILKNEVSNITELLKNSDLMGDYTYESPIENTESNSILEYNISTNISTPFKQKSTFNESFDLAQSSIILNSSPQRSATVSMIDLHNVTTPPLSILKRDINKSKLYPHNDNQRQLQPSKQRKSVRINETVELIDDLQHNGNFDRKRSTISSPPSPISISKTTPSNKPWSLAKQTRIKNKKKRITQSGVSLMMEYDEYRNICGNDKDPLNIILHK